MALKFVLSIVVLMNLNISVSGRSNFVSGTRYATYYCMDFVKVCLKDSWDEDPTLRPDFKVGHHSDFHLSYYFIADYQFSHI